MKKSVGFLTYCKFPDGDAASLRFMNVAALFYKIGYHSIVVGRGNTKRFQYNDFSFGKFVSLKKKKRSITFKILNFIFGFEKFFFARYFFKKHSNVDIIIIGFQLSFLLKRYICKKSKKCGMKVIFSIMEWYNFSQYISKPWFLHKYFSTHKTIKTLKISDGGVLSISTFLNNYFAQRNIKSFYLPFVMDKDIHLELPSQISNGKITFLYLGQALKKDDLLMMIEGFSKLDRKIKERIFVYIIGNNKKIRKKALKRGFLEDFVVFIDTIPHQEAMKYLSKTDFTILLRPPKKRYTKAGFPTKITESLFAGRPVVANITSDLNLYLVDEYNSIIVKKYSAESFAEAVKKVCLLSRDQVERMKFNARQTAISKLEISVFQNEFDVFLNQL